MANTATWIVGNPVSGQHYVAPSAFWFIPAAGTTITTTIQSFDSSGNLLVESTLAAIVRDVSSGVDKDTFPGSGANTTRAAYSGQNGSDVYAAAGYVVGSPASIRMYATYSGSAYDQPPNVPSNLTPSSGAIVTSQTPNFTGTFSDPTTGDSLKQYEIVIFTGSNGSGSQAWDSGIVNASSAETNARQFSRVSGVALTFGASYSWKARVANQNGLWSGYSGWVNFSVVQGPNAPTITAPTGQQSTTTPTWSAGYTSPTALSLASYHWWITAASGGATVFDNGFVTLSSASGTTVSSTFAGGVGLQPGQSYNFNLVWKDTNSALSPTSTLRFSIAPLPQATPASPINNATANSTTPTFAWGYSDPNYTQATYQIQIYNATTSALIKDTGAVSSAATSYTLAGTTIAYNTQIRWRIQVTDTAGLGSGWSAYAFATVNNAPQAAITAPTNASTITNNTPTITFTYTASAGGQLQASASIALLDANNNPLQTYPITGAGTSYTLPAGVLQNDVTYHLQITVTDTASQSGQSPTTSFTLLYTPPADMQGQGLTSGKNYLVSPYLNTDVDANSVADNWAGPSGIPAGVVWSQEVDTDIIQPIILPNGDGPFTGAQRITIVSVPNGQSDFEPNYAQVIDVATAGFTPNSTRLSFCVYAVVAASSGPGPNAYIVVLMQDSSFAVLATYNGTVQTDTNGQIVQILGPQNALVPTNCAHVTVQLRYECLDPTRLGTIWWMDAQAEVAASSDANFIGGGNGTGYSYDANNYSIRTQLAGNAPNLNANPGVETDPINASGGSITFTWDTSLADATRFVQYLIERRRQDQAPDDSTWLLLATFTNKSVGSYTDYTAGGNTVYQYSVRQQITYPIDGATGVSANRALVTGSVSYAPAWYLVNAQGTLYNLRLNVIAAKRQLTWKERAVYSDFLGRVGSARDAGPAAGYAFSLIVYFNDTWGDIRGGMRRLFVAMQQLNVMWYLKDPEGLVIPVFLEEPVFDEQDSQSDTLLSVTLNFVQAQDTTDY